MSPLTQSLDTTWKIIVVVCSLLPAAVLASLSRIEVDPLIAISSFFGVWMVCLLLAGIAVRRARRGLGWLLFAVLFLNLPLLILGFLPGREPMRIPGTSAVAPALETVLRWREWADRATALRGRAASIGATGFFLLVVFSTAFKLEVGWVAVLALATGALAMAFAALVWIVSLLVGGTMQPRYEAFRMAIDHDATLGPVAVEHLDAALRAEDCWRRPHRARAAIEILVDLGGDSARDALEGLVRDSRPEVRELRRAAIEGIEKLRGNDEAAALEAAAEVGGEEGRQLAERARDQRRKQAERSQSAPPLEIKRREVREMEERHDVAGLVEAARRGGLMASLAAGKALLELDEVEGLDALLNDTELGRYHERAVARLEAAHEQPKALAALRRAAEHPAEGELALVNDLRRKYAQEALERLPVA